MLGSVVGVLIGWVAWLLRGLGGAPLHLIAGGLAGTAGAGLVLVYLRSIRLDLSEATVNVPPATQLTFVVSADARDTAWTLAIELSTRVSTRPLAPKASLREALTSLYQLFQLTRELLAGSRPRVKKGRTVQHLGMRMLNRELRPFLARWHPRLTEHEHGPLLRRLWQGMRRWLLGTASSIAGWDHEAECRAELEALRRRLVQYAVSFAELADVDDPPSLLEPDDSSYWKGER